MIGIDTPRFILELSKSTSVWRWEVFDRQSEEHAYGYTFSKIGARGAARRAADRKRQTGSFDPLENQEIVERMVSYD